ncbi:hypothetical protein B5D77_10295 [Microcystis sp. MC19]|uniref:DUF2589 domain-containing protein n=1 Tax=Microcystis sp. MC19 TaxID=1967666 RepID=UPI000D13C892|nr:DUF2589 domain-containing protein [Microcystis sp. MC19]AVQ71640.1 hypothetical protein B5D77_10295 [Microcystis sp. MC19]
MSNHQAFHLHEIFSAPLLATIEADFRAANKYMEFVQEYGFESVSEEETPDVAVNHSGTKFGRLRMVNFWYNRRNFQTGKDEYVNIQVPALSLIPLPLLQVDDAEFSFNVHIYPHKSLKSRQPDKPPSLLGENSTVTNASDASDNLPPQPSFMASLPALSGQKGDKIAQTTANMKVKIKMRQADLPTGIANLMVILHQGSSIENRIVNESSKEETNSS